MKYRIKEEFNEHGYPLYTIEQKFLFRWRPYKVKTKQGYCYKMFAMKYHAEEYLHQLEKSNK